MEKFLIKKESVIKRQAINCQTKAAIRPLVLFKSKDISVSPYAHNRRSHKKIKQKGF